MVDSPGDFARKLRELGEATSALNGDITELQFDPHDPVSIESAIQQMETAINERVSSYAHNDLVMGISEKLKEKYRTGILERAAAARLEGDDEK